jgi:LmbE family N-acetylglucosaminyl deacetylase
MAGTLLLLKDAGYETHYMTLANGSCGSVDYGAARTRAIRRREAERAATLLRARFHASLVDDLEIFYEIRTLRRLAAIIREVRPTILLTHSPQDYMEDHINTCRLAVTAAFARGMPNFGTLPRCPAFDGQLTVYHAMPHGLCDPLRQPITPDLFVNTTTVHERKRHALAAHASQKDWLDRSQGMDSYLASMDAASLEIGRRSTRFQHAEAWRRRLHLGFCSETADPLPAALRPFCFKVSK